MPAAVPGFHSYHQNLHECIDWCIYEQHRQSKQWAAMRGKLLRAPELGYRGDVIKMDLRSISTEHDTVNQQLQAATDDQQRILPVYRLLRLLQKRGSLLNELRDLLDS